MAASITDKFSKTYNSGNPNVATVNSSRTTGSTTLACDNLAGWPTDTVVHFSTYQINTSNQVIDGTQTDWIGVVSGNSIGSLTRVAGEADSGNSIGDIVEMNPTASWANSLVEGILEEHNQDGSHNIAQLKDTNGNELLKFSATASAINEFTVANAATGNAPQFLASGDDTNIDLRLVPKGTGHVKRGATGGAIDWWEELGRTTLSGAGDAIDLQNIPARMYLRVLITVAGSGNISGNVIFNNDSGNNYSYRLSSNHSGTDTGSDSTSQAGVAPSAAALPFFAILDIWNRSGNVIYYFGQTLISAGATTRPTRRDFEGVWNNSSQISRITVNNGGTGDYSAGSEIIVLGHD